MDARGKPMVVLHKLSPSSSEGTDHTDRLIVDFSPLRLPEEFSRVERELQKRVLAEFNVDSIVSEEDNDNEDATDGENDWETRPIYQLAPHSLSWSVSRQQGKEIGKYLGLLFDNVEKKATKSAKPKGVKPGKSRRHGGYGIG
jgi:hypothetical protein